jgi:DNA polymerase alpha subunit A
VATANVVGLNSLTAITDKYLDRNGRRYVDMKSLFGFMERIKI